jgi:uncharacterized protein YndB with AHSA1/START domain
MTMKKLEYKTEINAKPEKVWKTMLEKQTYDEWVAAGWPGATYDGKWEKGARIRFLGADNQGGTIAEVTDLKKPEYIKAKHVAIILPGGSEDTNSPEAKGWIGTTEDYYFTEKNGKTELKVEINTNPDWESMFNEGWPKALKKLKEICERKAVTA